MMRRAIIFVAVPIALGGLAVGSVGACECGVIGTGAIDYQAALKRHEAVFKGTVLQIHNLGLPTTPPKDGSVIPNRMVVFDVDVAWAGVAARRVIVFTGIGGGDCGFWFEVGETYVVWADRGGEPVPGELSTGICTFTAPLQAAAEQVQQLGKGKKLKE